MSKLNVKTFTLKKYTQYLYLTYSALLYKKENFIFMYNSIIF